MSKRCRLSECLSPHEDEGTLWVPMKFSSQECEENFIGTFSKALPYRPPLHSFTCVTFLLIIILGQVLHVLYFFLIRYFRPLFTVAEARRFAEEKRKRCGKDVVSALLASKALIHVFRPVADVPS